MDSGGVFEIRELSPTDSIDELTELLHRAYAPLGARGLNFTAVDQSADVTRQRIAGGTCFVATLDERIVGTVTVERPDENCSCLPYRSPGVAAAHQFAVEPTLQGRSIGSRLLRHAEQWAAAQGYSMLAVDTAEPAIHLVAFYNRRGFCLVGRCRWFGKTYESVVLAKPLRKE